MPIPLLLHGRHAGPEVLYQPLGAWIVPWVIRSVDAEYAALRGSTGLIDYSTQAMLEVRGADRAVFLHNLLTNDIKGLAPGGGCRAALLDPSGKLLAECLVLADPDALWLMCDLPLAATVARVLEEHRFSEDVSLTNHERRYAAVALEGPRSAAALAQLAGRVVALPSPGDHAMTSLKDIPVRAVRHSLAGGIGYLCLVDADAASAAWNLLTGEAARYGVVASGWHALSIARIECGIPWFGIDMDSTMLLPETGLETLAVSDTKGCYLGQEIIARLAARGSVSRRLMRLELADSPVPSPGDEILHEGAAAGRITSAVASPQRNRPVAIGVVKRPVYEPGTSVEVVSGGSRHPATIVGQTYSCQ